MSQIGVCPAAIEASADGQNGGKNGGRICWAVTGTLCEGEVQGTSAQKRISCLICDFYELVREEEGPGRFRLFFEEKRYLDDE